MKFLWAISVLFSILISNVQAQECSTDGKCDAHERCRVWKDEGECIRNQNYMSKYCPVSCVGVDVTSQTVECKDIHPRCAVWAQLGECKVNREMLKYCAKSCDACDRRQTYEIEDDYDDDFDEDDLCVDSHENCPFWASAGECKANPKYMLDNCAKSCDACGSKTTKTVTASNVDTSILKSSENFGERQVASGADAQKTVARINSTLDYMKSSDFINLPKSIQTSCLNRHELCSFWAVLGESWHSTCERSVVDTLFRPQLTVVVTKIRRMRK